MKEYHNCVKYILENGQDVNDRTGVGTRSIFGYQMRFNLEDGFPAVTTKKLAWKAVVGELLWFLEGSTDERRLAELTFAKDRTELSEKDTIWTANADHQGVSLGYQNTDFYKELGPVYGFQWRSFDGVYMGNGSRNSVDQIRWVMDEIKNNPDSRRLIVSAWNPNQMDIMTLPPCHTLFQFRVYNNKLSCQLYQRSADIGLGVPFNIASYALLTHVIARECGLGVGDFVHTIGDAHIYNDHIEPLQEMLERTPYDLPRLKIDDSFDIHDGLDYEFSIDSVKMFVLENYKSHNKITMKMAV